MSCIGLSGLEARELWLVWLWLWDRERDLDHVSDEANLERVGATLPSFLWTSSRDSGYDRGRDDRFGLWRAPKPGSAGAIRRYLAMRLGQGYYPNCHCAGSD